MTEKKDSQGEKQSKTIHKLNVGWIYNQKQVKSVGNGGGIRIIEINDMDEVTVEYILVIEKAHSGKSPKGVQDDMEFRFRTSQQLHQPTVRTSQQLHQSTASSHQRFLL